MRLRDALCVVAGLSVLGACSSETPPDPGRKDRDGGERSPDAARDAGPPAPRDAAADARISDPDPDGGLDDLTPISLDGCKPGANGFTAEQIDALKGGGEAGALRFTYPYDGTVFPRGLEAPTVAWSGAANADAVYVHIKSRAFEYHGCTRPSGEGELLLDQNSWEIAGTQTYGKRDPFTVEITVSAGGKVMGPIRQSWVIARATIKGSVYYNSYFSLGGGGTAIGGKVFRIPPGKKAEGFLTMECNGCHSLSANGARMTSQTLGTGGRSYDLESGAPASKPAPVDSAYAALYPDGSRYLVGSHVVDAGRNTWATLFSTPTKKATLYDTDTGAIVPATGIPPDALMPSFSPDGKLLVFNDYALDQAHGLAAVDYDITGHRAINYRELLRTKGTRRPGWPFALPDNGGVIYVETESADFSAYGAGVGVPSATSIIAPYSELHMVDVDSGQTTLLARAMGFADAASAAKDETYLPFGAAELHKNYFPTVSPVAAGGYFWVFWDSIRHYGNRGLSRLRSICPVRSSAPATIARSPRSIRARKTARAARAASIVAAVPATSRAARVCADRSRDVQRPTSAAPRTMTAVPQNQAMIRTSAWVATAARRSSDSSVTLAEVRVASRSATSTVARAHRGG
jgi:hypothetical protein